MEALVMDTNFVAVGILDSYDSFIWTDRFSSCGDFEVYTTASKETFNLLRSDYYLWRKETNKVMIIDEVQIESDTEDGNKIIVSGESLEAILKRRIIWNRTEINGNLQEGVKILLDENIINPTDENRKIPNFEFEENTDERITSLTWEMKYGGDNLYDVICKICESKEIGFQITLTDDNRFIFKLLVGEDRSYAQELNTYVVFSPDWDNIINSNYLESRRMEKNVALVAGETEGEDDENRKTTSIGTATGLARRELYIEASDVSSEKEDDTKLTEEEYMEALKTRGEEELATYKKTHVYEGEMDANQMFVYGEDFFLGDVVQLNDEYGNESKARITEMIYSRNKSGFSFYPTFTVIDNEEGNGQ